MIDLVIPDKNENEFLKMAEKLNYTSICFLYDNKNKDKIKNSKIEIFYGFFEKNNNADIVIVKSSKNNRHFIEKGTTDILFELEKSEKKDLLHYRNSGLNQVLCKLANQEDVMIGFSFSSILNSDKIQKTQIMGRMQQNIKLCRKYKVRTVIASFAKDPYEMRSPHDLTSLGIVLGMHPKEAKDSLTNAYKRIQLNKKKKDQSYISEGVEIVK